MGSRALIIGPGDYGADSGIKSYREITQSAVCYEEVLSADRLWTGGVSRLTGGELQSINAVMKAIEDTAKLAEEGDTLLVVYIGHGTYWTDAPDTSLHFAVGSSREDRAYSWLSSWHVYRAMRATRASRKVLIADCCYTGRLESLGDAEDSTVSKAYDEVFEGTCVLTAVEDVKRASPRACGGKDVAARFQGCTQFSGHLLSVLLRGTEDNADVLTAGMVRDAVKRDMKSCAPGHTVPGAILKGESERLPLFTNRMTPAERVHQQQQQERDSAQDWVSAMKRGSEHDIDRLLRDPGKTGKVVALLSRDPNEADRRMALQVHKLANQRFGGKEAFASYWAEARALPA